MVFPINKVVFKNVYAAVGGIFILVGLILLLVGGVFISSSSEFFKNAQKTEGRIEQLWDGRTVVSYEVDGQEMESRLSFHSSNMRIGDPITIYVNKENPLEIRSRIGDALLWIFILVGGIELILGICLLGYSIKKAKTQKNLREEGRRIYATVVGIGINRKISSNYRHPYVLYCEYQELDGKREFVSDSIWERPDEELIGSQIPVYVDDKGNYVVDYKPVKIYTNEM